MKVLVINSGSSSLKYELIDMTNEQTLAKGICERIGIENSLFTYKNLVKDKIISKEIVAMPDHMTAINIVLKTLQDTENGLLKSIEEIDAIGHRVVHGGEEFSDSVIIDETILNKLEVLSELAPLHNPANIMGIKVMQQLLPTKKNVAVFDTAFHQSMPSEAYMYALPYEDYEDYKVRKYGFHGTSHKYVSETMAEVLHKPDAKMIICHLGNGASISAVQSGKVFETSMGLTPLQGLIMGTRCGDIDPAAVLYLMEKRNLTLHEMDERMNKKSGILGIFGKSSDFRDLNDGIDAGNERAKLAFDMFIHRIVSYIGSYAAVLNGVDAIGFTGGIGENGPEVREAVCKRLTFLGIKLDEEKNEQRIPGNVSLSKPDSKINILKIETQEELMIARDTYRLTK